MPLKEFGYTLTMAFGAVAYQRLCRICTIVTNLCVGLTDSVICPTFPLAHAEVSEIMTGPDERPASKRYVRGAIKRMSGKGA